MSTLVSGDKLHPDALIAASDLFVGWLRSEEGREVIQGVAEGSIWNEARLREVFIQAAQGRDPQDPYAR